MFDQRELKFEIGDAENLGFPIGVEKAILAMEQGEEATFTMKPKYDHLYQDTCLYFFVSLYASFRNNHLHKTLPAVLTCIINKNKNN